MIYVLEKSSEINWWAIAGSIASVLAALVAVITVWFQKYRYDKEKKPIVSPLIRRLNLENIDTLTDWETGGRIDKKWSEVKVPIKNYGKEPVIDMEYSYVFKNYTEVEGYLNKYGSVKSSSLKLTNSSFKTTKEEEILTEASLRGESFNYTIKRFRLNGNPVSSNEETEVSLPSYFIIVTNYLLTHHQMKLFEEQEVPFPVLEIYIHGKDTDHRHWLFIYELFLDSRMKNTIGSNPAHEIILNSNHVITKKLKEKKK